MLAERSHLIDASLLKACSRTDVLNEGDMLPSGAIKQLLAAKRFLGATVGL